MNSEPINLPPIVSQPSLLPPWNPPPSYLPPINLQPLRLRDLNSQEFLLPPMNSQSFQPAPLNSQQFRPADISSRSAALYRTNPFCQYHNMLLSPFDMTKPQDSLRHSFFSPAQVGEEKTLNRNERPTSKPEEKTAASVGLPCVPA